MSTYRIIRQDACLDQCIAHPGLLDVSHHHIVRPHHVLPQLCQLGGMLQGEAGGGLSPSTLGGLPREVVVAGLAGHGA